MEELKNIRNYQEFKDSLNEELGLFKAIGDLFRKIFSKITKPLVDSIANFTKRLDASNSWEESLKAFEDSSKQEQTIMNQSMNEVTGPLGLRKVVHDNAAITFIKCQEMSNKYQTPTLAAKNIFAGNAMFNFDNSEDFEKNAVNTFNAAVVDINKTAKAYDQAQLETYLKSSGNDINKVEQQQNEPATAGGTPVPAGGTPGNVSSSYKFINEVRTPEQVRQNPDPPKLNQQNTTTPPSNQQPANQPGQMPTGDLNKLKQGASQWIMNSIYGPSVNKMKQAQKPAGGEAGGDAFSKVATASKATGNKESLAKLLRNIVNIPDTNTLAKVRDGIARAENKDPNKFAEEIGKF